MQININEMDHDGGAYANKYLLFTVDPAEYTGRRALAVPRCCQKRKGTQDRSRINFMVAERDGVADREAFICHDKTGKRPIPKDRY